MKTTALIPVFVSVALTTIAGTAHAAFKCQGADGKIEYSDKPCDTTKNTLDKPTANKGVQSRPIGNPMEQLQKLFTDYEPRLCEREALSAELDRANRAGELTKSPAAWRVKQDKLIELNEVMVDFQLRASKITKPAGNDSAETAALRKFQAGLKACEQKAASAAAPAPATAAAPVAPAKPASK
jgi:hypothetical protein